MLLEQLEDVGSVAQRLGWELRAEGLCRDDVCLPLPPDPSVAQLAQRLRRPLVHDPEAGLWALGPPADTRVLSSAAAPDVLLPDLDGRLFELRSLRGKKVLLLAWASW